MNFYSIDIINNIVDNSNEDEIIDKLDNFEKEILGMFVKYSYRSISPKYVFNLLKDKSNKVVFHCMDNTFDIYNCPTSMIYNRYNDKENNEIHYYILMICTKHTFKNKGYASALLNGFIEKIKQEKNKINGNKTIKIILSSTVESVTFYEYYGFIWTRNNLTEYPILMKYEKYENDKEYFIMELIV